MTDTAGCTCDLSELGMVVWTAAGCPVHDCRPVRVPYVLDKDDPQVVEKAQANMAAAAAHYAERERVLAQQLVDALDAERETVKRVLRERIEALPGKNDEYGSQESMFVLRADVLAVFDA